MWFSKNDLTEKQNYAHKVAAAELPNYLTSQSDEYQDRKFELEVSKSLIELQEMYRA